jgi:EmrB/QacA subfamily drug resistance transporter
VSSRQRWTLVAACVATFMLLIDITVVNVALPQIQRDLEASFSDLQWVIDAYALTLAAFLLTAGSAADRVGRRKVFVFGLVVFTLASVACGLAHTPLALILSRGVQGIGGAVLFATSLALLAEEFEGRQRGTAFGIWGATIGGAVAVGPLVGGVLTDGLGWEWIFLVNVPVGLAAIALTLARVPESSDPDARKIDLPGVLTFSTALFCLIFAIVRGNAEGWGSTLIVSLFVASVVLMTAFIVTEMRVKEPMLDLSLFRKPAFAGASIVAFGLSCSMFSMFLYLTLYLQGVLGADPLDAGLYFLPLSVISFFVAPVAGRLGAQFPIRLFFGAGLTLVAVALLLMRGVDTDTEWTTLIPGFVLAGIGVGMVNPSLAQTAVGVVPRARSGMGSGINNTFRQVGIATGTAMLGAVFQARVESRLAGVPDPDRAAEAIAAGQTRGIPRAEAAFVSALDEILIVAAVIAFVAALLGLALTRSSDFVAPDGSSEPSPNAVSSTSQSESATVTAARPAPSRGT